MALIRWHRPRHARPADTRGLVIEAGWLASAVFAVGLAVGLAWNQTGPSQPPLLPASPAPCAVCSPPGGPPPAGAASSTPTPVPQPEPPAGGPPAPPTPAGSTPTGSVTSPPAAAAVGVAARSTLPARPASLASMPASPPAVRTPAAASASPPGPAPAQEVPTPADPATPPPAAPKPQTPADDHEPGTDPQPDVGRDGGRGHHRGGQPDDDRAARPGCPPSPDHDDQVLEEGQEEDA